MSEEKVSKSGKLGVILFMEQLFWQFFSSIMF